MVRTCHQASESGDDEYGGNSYRPQRSGELTSITSREVRIATIGHDKQEWFHLLSDSGRPICGNCTKDEITRCPHVKREVFASTTDVKWCPRCKRLVGMQ